MTDADFCVECGLVFGIVERSTDTPSTCEPCAVRLRPSIFGECELCRRIIEVGERFHLEWAKLCGECAKRQAKERDAKYPCNTLARSN